MPPLRGGNGETPPLALPGLCNEVMRNEAGIAKPRADFVLLRALW